MGLAICLQDKVTCNVSSPNAAYARNWYSATAYATVNTPVLPGQNGFFVYEFTVPVGTPPGTTVSFNGEVAVLSTRALVHPEGYFQLNTSPPATGPTTTAAFDPGAIAADGVSHSTLTVTVIGAGGVPDASNPSARVTVTRDPSSSATCRITGTPDGPGSNLAADGSRATAAGFFVEFTVTSTTLPGSCVVNARTDSQSILGSTAVLSTRVTGPAAKLVVSGGGAGTHPASLSGNCSIAGIAAHNNDDPSCTVVTVDLQDVNGLRVTGDNVHVVTATLEAGTCSGGSRGAVVIQGTTSSGGSSAASTAIDGRTTFLLSSPSAYPGCRVTFESPFVTGVSTTEAWSGP